MPSTAPDKSENFCPDASVVIVQRINSRAPGPRLTCRLVLFLQVVLKELVGELEVGLPAVHPGKWC